MTDVMGVDTREFKVYCGPVAGPSTLYEAKGDAVTKIRSRDRRLT